MRTRVRTIVAGLVALAAITPATVLLSAAPAGATPVGYTLMTEFLPVTFNGGLNACQLAQVDLATGVVSGLPDSGPESCVDDLTVAPDGSVYGIQLQCGGQLCITSDSSGFDDEQEPAQAAPEPPPAEQDVREGDVPQGEAEPPASAQEPAQGEPSSQQIDEEVHLIRFDTTSGAPTDLGAITGGPASTFLVSPIGFGGVTFDQDGNLYVELVAEAAPCNGGAFCLYRVDPANPASAVFVGTGTPETEFQVLAAGCDTTPEAVTLRPQVNGGATAEPGAAALPVSDQFLIARNLDTGATTPIGPTGEEAALTGMAFDQNGALWGVGFDGGTGGPSVFTIDTSTGAATATTPLALEEPVFAVGLALPLDCTEELVVRFTG